MHGKWFPSVRMTLACPSFTRPVRCSYPCHFIQCNCDYAHIFFLCSGGLLCTEIRLLSSGYLSSLSYSGDAGCHLRGFTQTLGVFYLRRISCSSVYSLLSGWTNYWCIAVLYPKRRPLRFLLLLLPPLCCISQIFYSSVQTFYSNWIFTRGKEGEE